MIDVSSMKIQGYRKLSNSLAAFQHANYALKFYSQASELYNSRPC